MSAPAPGDKRRGGIVARWHRPVTAEEVESALSSARHLFTWLSVQPVILALYVLDCADDRVVEALVRAGMKYTGARRLSGCPKAYYVLSMGVERLDVPLAYGGRRVVFGEQLEVAVSMANAMLSLAKAKLELLKRAASSIAALGCCDEATLCGAVEAMASADLAELRHC